MDVLLYVNRIKDVLKKPKAASPYNLREVTNLLQDLYNQRFLVPVELVPKFLERIYLLPEFERDRVEYIRRNYGSLEFALYVLLVNLIKTRLTFRLWMKSLVAWDLRYGNLKNYSAIQYGPNDRVNWVDETKLSYLRGNTDNRIRGLKKDLQDVNPPYEDWYEQALKGKNKSKADVEISSPSTPITSPITIGNTVTPPPPFYFPQDQLHYNTPMTPVTPSYTTSHTTQTSSPINYPPLNFATPTPTHMVGDNLGALGFLDLPDPPVRSHLIPTHTPTFSTGGYASTTFFQSPHSFTPSSKEQMTIFTIPQSQHMTIDDSPIPSPSSTPSPSSSRTPPLSSYPSSPNTFSPSPSPPTFPHPSLMDHFDRIYPNVGPISGNQLVFLEGNFSSSQIWLPNFVPIHGNDGDGDVEDEFMGPTVFFGDFPAHIIKAHKDSINCFTPRVSKPCTVDVLVCLLQPLLNEWKVLNKLPFSYVDEEEWQRKDKELRKRGWDEERNDRDQSGPGDRDNSGGRDPGDRDRNRDKHQRLEQGHTPNWSWGYVYSYQTGNPIRCALYTREQLFKIFGFNDIHLAIGVGNYDELVHQIQTNRDLINQEDHFGRTPIFYAIWLAATQTTGNRYEIIDFLVREGALLNITDFFGRTPVQYANEEFARSIADLIEEILLEKQQLKQSDDGVLTNFVQALGGMIQSIWSTLTPPTTTTTQTDASSSGAHSVELGTSPQTPTPLTESFIYSPRPSDSEIINPTYQSKSEVITPSDAAYKVGPSPYSFNITPSDPAVRSPQSRRQVTVTLEEAPLVAKPNTEDEPTQPAPQTEEEKEKEKDEEKEKEKEQEELEGEDVGAK